MCRRYGNVGVEQAPPTQEQAALAYWEMMQRHRREREDVVRHLSFVDKAGIVLGWGFLIAAFVGPLLTVFGKGG